jgi:hypothetical protein
MFKKCMKKCSYRQASMLPDRKAVRGNEYEAVE